MLKRKGKIMRRNITKLLLVLISIVLFAASGCSVGQDEDIIKFTDSAAENYLTATNNEDYAKFSMDLDEEMKKALPEDKFLEFTSQIKGIIGDYVPGSKKFVKTKKEGGFTSVIYNAEYTEEPAGVEVKIVISKVNNEMKISGSWFNSPKLRRQ